MNWNWKSMTIIMWNISMFIMLTYSTTMIIITLFDTGIYYLDDKIIMDDFLLMIPTLILGIISSVFTTIDYIKGKD